MRPLAFTPLDPMTHSNHPAAEGFPSLCVMKLGGAEGVEHGPALDDVAARVRAGEPTVIVHGGSAEADRLAADVGHPRTVLRSPSGHESRYTDPRTLELFVMATALVNRRIVGALRRRGVSAVGLSGLDGGTLLGVRKAAVRDVRNRRVRIVRDDWSGSIKSVDPGALRAILAAGHVPVVAPLAMTDLGEPLNVDGDRAAAAIAVALRAEVLVLLTGVPGLMERFPDPETLIRSVPLSRIDAALESAQGRMKRKVLSAKEALCPGEAIAAEGRGVRRVVIAHASSLRPLVSALGGGGTQFTSSLEACAKGVNL